MPPRARRSTLLLPPSLSGVLTVSFGVVSPTRAGGAGDSLNVLLTNRQAEDSGDEPLRISGGVHEGSARNQSPLRECMCLHTMTNLVPSPFESTFTLSGLSLEMS